jgi:excisionase family DNA binding protein
MTAERLLTARDVADRYGHHPETILRWVREGKMPDGIAFRTPGGGQLRFREDRLDAWEQRATTQQGGVTQPAGRRPAGNLASVTQPGSKED